MRRSFGRFAVILGTSSALAACSISASTSDSTTAASPPGRITLQSERGFELSYPSDWAQKENVEGLVAAFVTSPAEGLDDTFSENVNVVIDPAGAGLSPAE
jgi:hypothetical protein